MPRPDKEVPMQRYRAQEPVQAGESFDHSDDPSHTDRVVGMVASVEGVLLIIAGLLGAIAVQLIFVAPVLPQVISQSDLTSTSITAIGAGSDILGFAAFYALAGIAGSASPGRGRRHR
ncbi:MAG: hypothetical protein WB802_06410 [Candidatus Dormiibacterota bacterium]|jgi:hypothetical protein